MLPSLAALALQTEVKRSRDEFERPDPVLLTDAATKGNLERVRELLDRGADVNARDQYDETALFYASTKGHVAVVRLLLKHGADLTIKAPLGFTPIIMACSEGHEHIVELLLDHGVDVNKVYKYRITALRMAVTGNHATVVKLLLERGADVEQVDLSYMELSEEIQSLIADSKGIRARYLLKEKFRQIVTAKRVAVRLFLKLRVLVDGKKFAPPMRGERPPMRGEEGGEGFYAVEREFMDRLSRGNTSMSFSEFLRARMRGSA